jgi:hypothetical protein
MSGENLFGQFNLTYFVGQKRDGGHRPMAAATGAVEITLPVAIVAAAYIIGQAMVDASGE